MATSPKTVEQESLERLRRIETRITTVGIALGVPMGTDKPRFDPSDSVAQGRARMFLPSIHCSFSEIIKTLPPNWVGTDPVDLYIGSDLVGTVLVKR